MHSVFLKMFPIIDLVAPKVSAIFLMGLFWTISLMMTFFTCINRFFGLHIESSVENLTLQIGVSSRHFIYLFCHGITRAMKLPVSQLSN